MLLSLRSHSARLLTFGVSLALAAPTVLAAGTPGLAYETTIGSYYLGSGRDVVVDGDGNAFVIGRAIDPVGDDNDLVVAKVSADGMPLWHFAINGEAHDIYGGAAVDANGDLWVTGWTDSTDYPTTPDALDRTLTGFRDVFVTKFSSEDGSILYSTLIGGDYTDGGNDIAIGPDGNIYLTGFSGSSDFPVVNPIQANLNSYPYQSTDAFVTIMSPDGQSLLYSTYLGGSTDDSAHGLALDADGNIFIHGNTLSDDWPVVSALQPNFAGGRSDTFVTRLSADGQQIDFSTYLGGEDVDRPGGLAVDANGDVYVTGITRSVAFPTTPGSFQPNFVGAINGCSVPFGGVFNCEDGFVSKISGDGSIMMYSTYLGGSNPDEARNIAVDAGGSARVVGYTSSPDFPGNVDGSAAIFVARLNLDGSDVEYIFTKQSGSANAGHGVAVDDEGSTYFTGALGVPATVYLAKLNDGATGPAGDIDGDGDVDQADLGALLSAYGTCAGDGNWNAAADLTGDGCVSQDDLGVLLGNYGA